MKLAKISPNITPFVILIFGIMAVSTSSLIIRNAQKEVPSLVIAVYRLWIAALILGIIAWIKNKTELKIISKKQIAVLFLSGLFLAGHFAAWITSLEYTSIVSSVVLVCSTPLWVALLSPLFIKEMPGKYIWIGLTFTLMGAIIVGLSGNVILSTEGLRFEGIISKNRPTELYGNSLALLGAWSETGYILIGRGLRKKISLAPYTFMVYGSAAIFLLIPVIMLGLRLTGYSTEAYLWMAALGTVPQLIGHTSFNWALEYLNATFVSVALLGEPVGTTILSFVFLREIPTIFEFIGGLMILIGIYITSKR